MPLKDHADAGTFTFRVTLHSNGDIVFTYKQVPMSVTAIVEDQQVKVGLSDASSSTPFSTIYEYHKIDMKKRNMIGNWTAILFKALPTCVSMHSCSDCLSMKTSFQCQWCDAVDRCSNGGLDRHRQAWLLNSCETRNVQLADHCPNATTTTTTPTTSTTTPETKEEEEEIVEPVNGFDTENATVDHDGYYRSQVFRGVDEVQRYWVDLDSSQEEKALTNETLSVSHRRATVRIEEEGNTVRLTFEFPFYGHLLRNITIATGGFLFTGAFLHKWLTATQYIAPLMANFDTSMNKNASVKYADNGTSFTVQWNNMPLKDHADAGTFTFQVTLHSNGDIVFTYKQVPMSVTAIVEDQHPVKVGLSDAYIGERTIFFVRRKTIYEYHKIDMKKRNMIGNWTAILFKALPTCVSMHSCSDCLSMKTSFQCQWCDAVDRCSDGGLDRHRQAWLLNSCETRHVQLPDHCPPPDGILYYCILYYCIHGTLFYLADPIDDVVY
ncbi:Plexin domain-containing protein 2 [Chionoecetes opilio]|uniref:Plexin domain-containing protein 2 n=1 Tax=Chionoecetes opilio TaxID=41210 RepID=A0A8J5CYR3_CHIOP|nr:Plexin domain-containing protein 2 [Chionoecetes opilio]